MQRIRKFFQFEERNTSLRTEIIGGIVTFLAMSYILVVNPGIVGGGFGVPVDPITELPVELIPYGGVFLATAIGAAVATIFMALFAKIPVALAPGMGVNAFFVNTIIVADGFSWQEALAISFIGGVIFIAISFTKLRSTLISAIPKDLQAAIGVGIGFFIALVGLKSGGVFSIANGSFSIGDFASPLTLLSLFSIAVIFIVHSLKHRISRFSFIISIVLTAILGLILSSCGIGIVNGFQTLPFISDFDYTPLGDFSKVAGVGVVDGFSTLFSDAGKIPTILFLIFALLFVDIFDTAGTLVAVCNKANIVEEVEVKKIIDGTEVVTIEKRIPNIDKALFADAVGTVLSSSLGTPEITSYVESATGVEAGARTGFSSLVVAVLFLLSIALFPIFNIFTNGAVTCGALVLVGVLMAQQASDINWKDISIAIPAFMTIAGMVITGSVADGIAFGFITYTLIKLIRGEIKQVHPIIYVSSGLFIVYFGLMAAFG